MDAALDPNQLAAGRVCLAEVVERGQLVFEHEYGFADGLGAGGATKATKGPFRRIHEGIVGGPETIACSSCHWVGGPAGAGAETDNAFLLGDGARADSADQRNPPALVALGVVEALAREMSHELQAQRAALIQASQREGVAREVSLESKGVRFGTLRLSAKGEIDTSGLRGIDADLVVKPFGWKGTLASIEAFAADALQVHLAIETPAQAALPTAKDTSRGGERDDRDGDGMRHELGRGPFMAMVAHLALLELPIVEPFIQDRQLPPAAAILMAPTTTSFVDDFQHGRALFHDLGCATCHQPMMVLKNPVLDLQGLPPLDLAQHQQQPALTYDRVLGGYPVWLFSDLRRHDMGAANRARNVQSGVPEQDYLTPRLWGVADSAPYLHDGRAPSFDYAIAGHDGEGAAARAAFNALSREDKGALDVYLISLRRVPRLIVP